MIIKDSLSFIGDCVINLIETVKCLFKCGFNLKNTLYQAAVIGYDSISIVMIIIFITGSVISLQLAKYFYMSGADAYVGGLVSIAITRELAPVFSALAIGARAGTAIASELGNMSVTEQVDALKVLKVSPAGYLILPRLLAGIVVIPMVTILSQLVGIVGGMWVAQTSIGMHPNRFINSVWLYTRTYDIGVSLFKSLIFGILIIIICCTQGLNTRGGAREVGQSTTMSSVWMTLTILVFDYFLTWMFY